MSCSFCAIVRGEVDAHVVYSDERFVAFLDHRPLFAGHCLLVPRRRKDGLRGFFWPRTKYASDDEMAEYAEKIRASLS